ncbi:DUF3558 family protein [Pseudonocardia benzenivorans]|uniref:DUF3558 family protein n=1 Tax=Pseudonocardia benzenivorans TaxID=228005 RepID=A0ABW3VTK7_9PSEU
MRATRLLPGIVLLVGALLAGCSSPTPGAPAPAAPVASTPAGPPELALDGVDPCSLITAADRTALDLGMPDADKGPSGLPLCRWNRHRVAFQIAVAIGANPDDFKGYSPAHSPDQVNGYPALRMKQPGAGPGESCILSIGVKPNQVLQVLVGDLFTASYADDSAICNEAERFAALALSNLGRR